MERYTLGYTTRILIKIGLPIATFILNFNIQINILILRNYFIGRYEAVDDKNLEKIDNFL